MVGSGKTRRRARSVAPHGPRARRVHLAGALALCLIGALLVACQPSLPGSLAGTVRGPDGAPLGGMQVALYNASADPTPIATRSSAANGTYDFGVLAGGTYHLGVTDPSGTYRDYWHATARALAWSAPIDVNSVPTTIDVQLSTVAMQGALGGVVRDRSAPGLPLAGITVSLFNAQYGTTVQSTTTAANGAYQFTALEPSAYKVGFVDPAGVFAPQFGQAQFTVASAEAVTVPPATTATADAALIRGGSIAGVITDGVTGVGPVTVVATSESPAGLSRIATTGADGRYMVPGLVPGTYIVSVADGAWYVDPTKGFRPITIGTTNRIDQAGATRFVVTSGQTTTADGVLAGASCDPATFHAGVQLDGATVAGLRLSDCDLSNASLRNLVADNVDLHAADLRGADLRGAHLAGADLSHAQLAGADLTGADLRRTKFAGATFAQTRCTDGVAVTSPATCGAPVPTITVSFTPNPVIVRNPYTVNVTVNAVAGRPTPTGTVVLDSTTPVPLVGGTGTSLNPSAPGPGPLSVRVDYTGDDFYESASTVASTTTELGREPYAGSGVSVGMTGDSITFWSKPALDRRFSAAGTFRYSVTGVNGATSISAAKLVGEYAATTPSIMILELGANDVGNIARGFPEFTIEGYEQRVAAYAAQFPQACVVVTTVGSHRTALTHPFWEQNNAAARTLNAWLHATFPNVIEWDDAIAASLAAGKTILADEVHPNDAGFEVLADLAVAAATRCAAH